MAERYDVAVRVVSQKGTCNAEHKVGDEWVIGRKSPEGICLSAFNALLPELRALMKKRRPPEEEGPDVIRVTCPDTRNPVVFELRRLRK